MEGGGFQELAEAGRTLPWRFWREQSPADTSICKFLCPELWENTFLLFKPPSLGNLSSSPSRLPHPGKKGFTRGETGRDAGSECGHCRT